MKQTTKEKLFSASLILVASTMIVIAAFLLSAPPPPAPATAHQVEELQEKIDWIIKEYNERKHIPNQNH